MLNELNEYTLLKISLIPLVNNKYAFLLVEKIKLTRIHLKQPISVLFLLTKHRSMVNGGSVFGTEVAG